MLSKCLAICFILFTNTAFSEMNVKIATLKEANKLSEKVVMIVEKNQLPRKEFKLGFDFEYELKKIYQNTNNIDVLHYHADNCLVYMSPGRPEDQLIDEVFELAWKESINRIVEIGGKNAEQALIYMDMKNHFDASFSLFIEAALSKFHK